MDASAHPPSLTPCRDPLALDAHVRACDRSRSPGFALYCVGERMHEMLAPRFVTTVVAATSLLALLAGCI